MANDLRLGVNIDHVATVRNARGGVYPDPLRAAKLAEEAGADGLSVRTSAGAGGTATFLWRLFIFPHNRRIRAAKGQIEGQLVPVRVGGQEEVDVEADSRRMVPLNPDFLEKSGSDEIARLLFSRRNS